MAIDALESSKDQYKAISISTSHLTMADMLRLTSLAYSDSNGAMILSRDTGFFQKLYNESEYNINKSMSPEYNFIVETAHQAGFRMIEFDSSATEFDCFPEFEHIDEYEEETSL